MSRRQRFSAITRSRFAGTVQRWDAKRQPAYVLDHDLSMNEYEVRNAIFTNILIMQGLKAMVMKHTSGDILLIGHSTSGELWMLA
jgi:hypothetical protein